MKAAAYLNHGRWVADCPEAHCTDARAVYPEDADGNPSPARVLNQVCKAGHAFTIEMPPAALEAQLVAAVSERLSQHRMNWFPKNHPLALLLGAPHGQTIRQLREEAERGENDDAERLAERRAQLLAQMRDLGVTPDEALAALKGS